MTCKFRFLYIIVAIAICVFLNIVVSGKVNASDEPATITVSGVNDLDDMSVSWGLKEKDDDSSSDDDSGAKPPLPSPPSPHK